MGVCSPNHQAWGLLLPESTQSQEKGPHTCCGGGEGCSEEREAPQGWGQGRSTGGEPCGRRKRGAGGSWRARWPAQGRRRLQPSHLSVSTRSLLSGSFRFLKKQSEGEFSAGTSVRAGPGRCHRWVGRTQAQKATCPSLAGCEARWPAAPHTGRVTVPLQQGAQHGGGGLPLLPARRSWGGGCGRAFAHGAHSPQPGLWGGGPALGPQGWVSQPWSS